MITLDQFRQLSPGEQQTYIWENCLYLTCRENETGLVKLYQVDNFFVEVCFQNPNVFEVIQAFRTPGLLLPYVDQLDLSALFKRD